MHWGKHSYLRAFMTNRSQYFTNFTLTVIYKFSLFISFNYENKQEAVSNHHEDGAFYWKMPLNEFNYKWGLILQKFKINFFAMTNPYDSQLWAKYKLDIHEESFKPRKDWLKANKWYSMHCSVRCDDSTDVTVWQ